MERQSEINLPLTISLSLCLHLFLVWIIVMPSVTGISLSETIGGGSVKSGGEQRDVVRNANEDDKENYTRETVLSEKDSSGRGFLTREKGDTYLNNALEFSQAGSRSSSSGNAGGTPVTLPQVKVSAKTDSKKADEEENQNGITILTFSRKTQPAENSTDKKTAKTAAQSGTDSEWTKIPDKKGVSPENAIFITNDGRFSYNTKKFTDFKFFHSMKSKISSNWFPPIAGNAYLMSGPNRGGSYTPGYTRIMAIPSQEVKVYFRLKRNGDVIDVVVLEGGTTSLVESCVSSIVNSKSFGEIPEDIKGEIIVINFMFGYYTN